MDARIATSESAENLPPVPHVMTPAQYKRFTAAHYMAMEAQAKEQQE